MPDLYRRKRKAESSRRASSLEQEEPVRKSARLEAKARQAQRSRAAEDEAQRAARLEAMARQAQRSRAAEDEAQRAARLEDKARQAQRSRAAEHSARHNSFRRCEGCLDTSIQQHTLSPMTTKCSFCQALHFLEEKPHTG